MPNVNPPVDAEQTERAPEVVIDLLLDGGQVRIGHRRETPTLPEPDVYRYVITELGGERYGGYLWRI